MKKGQMAGLLAAILLLCASYRLIASEHPVPLEKGVSEAKCLECHSDKTKGRTVHAAVGMGCFTCHVVRQSTNQTRITLKSGRPATLCFSCHDDKQPAKIKGRIHPPAQSDCLKCHDPHVSANDKLLLKTTAGGKNENLCLSCHTDGLDVPQGGSRHAALDMGCNTCHTVHKTGEHGKQEFAFHLTKSTPALCLDCHEAQAHKLVEAHGNQPFGSADCITCHDPHQSRTAKLMQASLHSPFEAKACDSCHQPAQGGKVVLTQANAKAVCATCHEEQVKKIDTAKVAHLGAQGDCASCHDPHGGRSAPFLKPDPVAACTACHRAQAEALTKKASLHDPAFNQKCSICHEAHGGSRPALLRDNVDNLCLSCHGPDAKAVKAQDGSSESILGNTVRLPLGYVAKARRIEISSNGLGHPVPGHPLIGQDPRDKSKAMSCISCHDPHAGDTKPMLLSAKGSVRGMCQECHKDQTQKEQSQ